MLPTPATVVSAYVTVTSLSQLSLAVATPNALTEVSASHYICTFASDVFDVGAVVSTTVIV